MEREMRTDKRELSIKDDKDSDLQSAKIKHTYNQVS